MSDWENDEQDADLEGEATRVEVQTPELDEDAAATVHGPADPASASGLEEAAPEPAPTDTSVEGPDTVEQSLPSEEGPVDETIGYAERPGQVRIKRHKPTLVGVTSPLLRPPGPGATLTGATGPRRQATIAFAGAPTPPPVSAADGPSGPRQAPSSFPPPPPPRPRSVPPPPPPGPHSAPPPPPTPRPRSVPPPPPPPPVAAAASPLPAPRSAPPPPPSVAARWEPAPATQDAVRTSSPGRVDEMARTLRPDEVFAPAPPPRPFAAAPMDLPQAGALPAAAPRAPMARTTPGLQPGFVEAPVRAAEPAPPRFATGDLQALLSASGIPLTTRKRLYAFVAAVLGAVVLLVVIIAVALSGDAAADLPPKIAKATPAAGGTGAGRRTPDPGRRTPRTGGPTAPATAGRSAGSSGARGAGAAFVIEDEPIPESISRLSPRARQRRARDQRRIASRNHSRGAFDRAEMWWRRSLQQQPDSSEGASGLARTLAGAGRADEAMAWARRAVERSPDNSRSRQTLGDLLLDGGDVQGAIEQYEAGLLLRPRNRQLEARLARARARLGEPRAQ